MTSKYSRISRHRRVDHESFPSQVGYAVHSRSTCNDKIWSKIQLADDGKLLLAVEAHIHHIVHRAYEEIKASVEQGGISKRGVRYLDEMH